MSDDASFSTQDLTINVTDVNESPVGAISDTDGSADAVAEDAGIGDAVGITAFANDPDAADNVTYSLDNDAGGLFTINGTTGVVTVNGSLDAETSISHTITVRATSNDTSFATHDVGDVDRFMHMAHDRWGAENSEGAAAV